MQLRLQQYRLLRISVIVSAWLFAVPTFADDETLDADFKLIQGRWQRKVKNSEGKIHTVVKEHRKNQSLLTVYDPDGNLTYAHTSEFRLERSGKVRLFVYRNRTITAGADAGKVAAGPFSYIYRVDKKQFIEVHGLLDGDAKRPQMAIWQRLPDDQQKTALK